MKWTSVLCLVLALLVVAGCKPKAKDIPPLQRKEAANLVSEAQFAVTLHDYARAEPLLDRATKLCPDTGDYWISLGVVRRRQGNTSGAKQAYEQARSAFHDAYEIDSTQAEAALQAVYTLALLGRTDDARKALEKAAKKQPDSRPIRNFVDSKQLDRIVADPGFREIALQ